MNEANMPVLVLYALLYPVVLAGLLHLALKSNRFERWHLLIGTASIGFLLGVGGNLAFIQLLSGFDQGQFGLLTVGHTFVIGLIAAWRLFAIVFIWTVYPDLFWATVLLAGLLMMESGPIGVRILAAAFSQKEWLAVSWVLPFFVLGALTHSILHAGVPAGYPGYYRFSLGRTLLVILLIPLMALLSWCASFFTSGVTVFR